MEDEILDWIKIYRKTMKWEWTDDPFMFALWIRLLLEANYADERWHGKTIKRGQLVTSLGGLSIRSGIPIQSLRTCLQKLVESEQITKESTNKYTIITICNYDRYQTNSTSSQQTTNNQITNDQQTGNNQPTINQQTTNNTTRNKEGEEIEEEKNIFTNYQDNSLSVSPTDGIPWSEIVRFFNETTKCVFGKIRLPFSETRKSLVRARIKSYGIDTFYEVIRKAAASKFLAGDNNRSWTASFDWMMRPSNFEKILSGNYDDKAGNTVGRGGYKGDATIGTEFTYKQ